MKVVSSVSKFGTLVYVLSALVPLSKGDAWWLRVWDFPRLQLLFLGLGFGTTYLASNKDRPAVKYSILTGLLIGAGFDFYRILPYTKVWPVESIATKSENKKRSISLVTVNVFQKNDDYQKLLEIIKEKSPDVIFLLEVNEKWLKAMSVLTEEYKYQITRPQDNTYGLAFFSRYPLENEELRFLVEQGVPSIKTDVVLPSGERIKIFGLHPKPPRYDTGPTTHRDAELVIIAKEVRKTDMPVIVIGDLNDVAWSHTTRLFRRISTLLDPRVGREAFPTFPTYSKLLRFPLDYVFHSDIFTLNSIQRLEKIGSDHFPIYASLNLEPRKEDEQEGPKIDEGDLKEAKKTIRKAKTGLDAP